MQQDSNKNIIIIKKGKESQLKTGDNLWLEF